MRKIHSLIVTMLLVGVGLVGVSTPVSAGEPYPGTVKTYCKASALNKPKAGKPVKARFRVNTAGSGQARGRVIFQYQRRSNGVVVRQFSRIYVGGGYTKYRLGKVRKGRFVVRVYFDSRPGDSVYKNCRTTFRQRVR